MTRIQDDTKGWRATVMRARAIGIAVAGIVAVAVLAAGGAKAAGLLPDGQASGIDAALTRAFAAQDCLTTPDAMKAVRAILDTQGGVDWTVEPESGVGGDACVSAGIVQADRLVVLIPAARGAVVQATQSIAGELMTRCLKRDEAIRFVSSTLGAVGVVGPTIRTDGRFAFPDGQEAAVRAHVAAGCYVWSSSGHDADGRPVYFLFGPGA